MSFSLGSNWTPVGNIIDDQILGKLQIRPFHYNKNRIPVNTSTDYIVLVRIQYVLVKIRVSFALFLKIIYYARI